MSIKKILSWLLLLFGEAILITAFILLRGETPDNMLVLNILVSTVIYALFFLNFRTPWSDLNDRSQKQIGTIGIRWFTVWFYSITAVAVMLAANLALELSFVIQLVIHFVLLFFLLLGVLASLHSSNKVKDVYDQETANRSGIFEMKKAMLVLKNKISETAGLPDDFIKRINALEESLRFISPSENSEANALEQSFIESISDIRFALTDYSLNAEQIESNLIKCERLYQNRKNMYSN